MGLSDHVLNIQQQKQAQQAQQSQQSQQLQQAQQSQQSQQLQQTNNFKLYPPRPVNENGKTDLRILKKMRTDGHSRSL